MGNFIDNWSRFFTSPATNSLLILITMVLIYMLIEMRASRLLLQEIRDMLAKRD